MYYLLLYYFFLLLNNIIIGSYSILIKNENELIDSFVKSSEDSLTLTIDNKKITILNNIKINNDHLKNISINGVSKESSILNFNNINHGFIFNNTIDKIKFNDITINGHLEFIKAKNVVIENAVINGSMDFDNNVKLIELNSLQFFGLSSGRFSCINLYGNVNIKYSSFFGNYYCLNSILTYYGESINSIDISNSYFNGVYLNTCIIINSAKLVNIFSSKFENGSSYLEEGYILIKL